MEINIIVYTNLPEVVSVNGEKMQTGLAKNNYGDWEKEGSPQEKMRRRNKGISHFKLNVTYEMAVIENKNNNKLEVRERIEPQFQLLEELNTNEEEALKKLGITEKENTQCEGITKSGKRCKREKVYGEKYCSLHIDKGE